MNLLFALLAASIASQTSGEPTHIGAHYTDDLAGLAIYKDPRQSMLLSIGWEGKDGVPHQGYKDLVAAKVHFGEASPDDRFHRISWTVDSSTVTYEWGLYLTGAVGQVRSTGPVEIRMSMGKAWPGSQPEFDSDSEQLYFTSGSLKMAMQLYSRQIEPVAASLAGWQGRYLVDPENPVQFVLGTNIEVAPRQVGTLLHSAELKYKSKRLWAEGDWGDFLSPIEDQMGNSKVYSVETRGLAHIVSRQWCLPDGQVLFCWDSFFNGLLSSLEDPEGAKQTVRAILAAATPAGFVPNYFGRGWGVSSDRSQPPDGAYCIWKIHQRQPDLQFLRETYPKLMKWHRWWFDHRDGNGDGLLEWGSATKDLQNAKFESGLDDSPMFDDAAMVGPHMNVDSTDLNALWAMDARYLSYIADAIGQTKDAAELRLQCAHMAERMNRLLWNKTVGAYCYRYWVPRQATEALSMASVMSAAGKPGLVGSYFDGRELSGPSIDRHDKDIQFDWTKAPIDGLQQTNFSARWTAKFTAPRTDPYVFTVTADDGARLWLDGKLLIDAWAIHGATKYSTPAIPLIAGQAHDFKLEYFQAEGGAMVHLDINRVEADAPGETFSTRLSPLNFYPLIVNAPSTVNGKRTLDLFFRPDRFDGTTICPTISKNDPAYPAQGYWRGTVWGPTSYLAFQGIRNYATPAQRDEYASKSVALFMKNWNEDGTCHENFNAITGWGRSDPHYTWGALLCLIGLEELCDIAPDGSVVLNGMSGRHIVVHNLRLKGRMFDLNVTPGMAVLSEHGKTVAVARGKIASVRL